MAVCQTQLGLDLPYCMTCAFERFNLLGEGLRQCFELLFVLLLLFLYCPHQRLDEVGEHCHLRIRTSIRFSCANRSGVAVIDAGR